MADSSSNESSVSQDAESAFMTLSHDLRLEILLALWDAPGYTLSFSNLRKAVGERDSGSFNYHLSQLEDHFVSKTDQGYELQYPGHRVLDAIQSGVFHEGASVGPVELEANCQDCGSGLAFEYGTDYIARILCLECGNRALEWPFDPGGIADRDDSEVVAAFDRRTRLIWSCALDGVCPFCAGKIAPTVTTRVHEEGVCIGVIEQLERYQEYFAKDHPAVVSVDCQRCSFYSFIPVGVALLTSPEAVMHLQQAGVNVKDTPLWDLDFVVDPQRISVIEQDPLQVEISVSAVEDPMTFLTDTSLNSVEVKQP